MLDKQGGSFRAMVHFHTYADSGWYATALTGLTTGWDTQGYWRGDATRFCDPANAHSVLEQSDLDNAWSKPPVRA